jgi:uncharacterized protein YndB with AHSA1/START domain
MKVMPFVKEVTINAPVSKVWKAITDKDEMNKWYFDLPEFAPVVGCEFHFYGGPPEKSYKHLCKVTEVNSGKKITYSWSYEGEPGKSYVTFELFDEQGKTRVKLTHEGLETFTSGNPDLAPENFAKGWYYIIGKSLIEYIEN